MAITPTQFAKTTRQCELYRPIDPENPTDPLSSGQLERRKETGSRFLQRMDPSCMLPPQFVSVIRPWTYAVDSSEARNDMKTIRTRKADSKEAGSKEQC